MAPGIENAVGIVLSIRPSGDLGFDVGHEDVLGKQGFLEPILCDFVGRWFCVGGCRCPEPLASVVTVSIGLREVEHQVESVSYSYGQGPIPVRNASNLHRSPK